ncbi:MAG: hypothetical protein ACM3QY_09350, partial [Candidatus Levyibacteriota bacterium]
FLQWVDHGSIAHVGGTSWKTPETKELIECYVDQRFLEFVHDDVVRRRYARRFRPWRSAAEVRASMPMTPQAYAWLEQVDGIVDRIVRALGERGAPAAAALHARH